MPFFTVLIIVGVLIFIPCCLHESRTVLSKFAVGSSVDIAGFIGLSTSIMGATIIGLGTSLPELATTIQALKQGLVSMALGNLLGSCITNITLILGVLSLLSFSPVNVVAVQSIIKRVIS